jgi:hypothetical protein
VKTECHCNGLTHFEWGLVNMNIECKGCDYLNHLNGCLICRDYITEIGNCPCQECIVKINCTILCDQRASWRWFVGSKLWSK